MLAKSPFSGAGCSPNAPRLGAVRKALESCPGLAGMGSSFQTAWGMALSADLVIKHKNNSPGLPPCPHEGPGSSWKWGTSGVLGAGCSQGAARGGRANFVWLKTARLGGGLAVGAQTRVCPGAEGSCLWMGGREKQTRKENEEIIMEKQRNNINPLQVGFTCWLPLLRYLTLLQPHVALLGYIF